MRIWRRGLLALLALCLLASGCGNSAAEQTEPAMPRTESISTATEPTATEATESAPSIFPVGDQATGTLQFYIGGVTIHAGGPVSDILAIGIRTEQNLESILLPGHISGNIMVRVMQEGSLRSEEPIFYFNAINTSDVPKPVSECRIYSLSVNTQQGIAFGSGNEIAPFVTGESTCDELTAAYGQPDYYHANTPEYAEMAYYSPFNYVYFSFKDGIVRQIMTTYSADIHGHLAQNFDSLPEGYFGNDALILMSQYMDVSPYLPENGGNARNVCPELDMFIRLGEDTVELGCEVRQMPERFAKPFHELLHVMDIGCYFRSGKDNAEEFYLLNEKGLPEDLIRYGTVMGVITQNADYTNWGADYSDFLEMSYQGIDNSTTISDVLTRFGQPAEIHATSSAKACFVWLHYVDAAGNILRIRVDPMVDQVAELRVMKYYPDARMYN